MKKTVLHADFQCFNSLHLPAQKKIQTIQNCCKRKQILQLSWPVPKLAPASNRKPWETRLPKKHKSRCTPGGLPSHWGDCRGALPSFHWDFLDTYFHSSKFRRKRVSLALFPTSSSCQHVCRTHCGSLQAKSTSEAGCLYTDGADEHKQPRWGFSALWPPQQHLCPSKQALPLAPCSAPGMTGPEPKSSTKHLHAPTHRHVSTNAMEKLHKCN